MNQCPGCDHSMARHFYAGDETIRCLHVEQGVSDRGILGIPWRRECDCVDGKSEQTTLQREYDKKERDQRDEVWKEVVKEAQRLLDEQDTVSSAANRENASVPLDG